MDEAGEGHGEDLRLQPKAFDERREFGIGGQGEDIIREEFGFEGGDSAEAPVEVAELDDEFVTDVSGGRYRAR